MTRNITLILLSICFFYAQAQDAYVNESKYWFYRYRLLTEFLVNGESNCGEPSGLSIPCGSAYSAVDEENGNKKIDELGIPFDTRQNYGDGSSFLGYYIGVLATEFKLLKNNGDPAAQWQLDKVKEELYFAMRAFERLDKNGEILLNATKLNRACDDNGNGFFLRDDVPASFNDPAKARQLNTAFRYRDANGNPLNRQITSNHGDRRDDPLEKLGGKTADHAYISIDQCADLFVGFSLVTKLMDDESWNGYHFKAHARIYTDLIATYLQDHDFFIPIPGQDGKCTETLSLKLEPGSPAVAGALAALYFLNPVMASTSPQALYTLLGIDASVTLKNKDCLVKHGALEARGLAYPFAQAANMIYNDKLGAYKKLSINPIVPMDYQNTITSFTRPLWNNLDYPKGKLFFDYSRKIGDDGKLAGGSNDYNNAIVATFAAIGNSWETGFSPTKVFDEELTIPGAAVCWEDECTEICGVWPFDKDCHTVCVPRPYPCDLYLGRVQAYCYSMPTYIQSNVFYELTKDLFPANQEWASSALAALFANSSVPMTGYCIPIFNPTGQEIVPRITYNTTGRALGKYADAYDLQLFPLLHRVLHNNEGDYDYDEDHMRYRMNSAPCNGPHYFPFKDPHVNPAGEGDAGVPGWDNDNNFQKTISPTKRSETKASFPGLDYMLYYNLYSLVYGNWTTADGYHNQMNVNVVNKTYPYSVDGLYWGSDVTPKKVIAYDYLHANNNTINAGQLNTIQNGNVVFKAGESMKITNLTVKSGASFKAYIEKSTPCGEYNTARVVSNTQEEGELAPKKTWTDEEYQEHVKHTLEKEVENYKKTIQQEQKKQYQSVESYIATQPNTSNQSLFQVSVYPNPFASFVQVSSLFNALDKIELYDAMGNRISEYLLGGEKSVSVSTDHLAAGLYYVKVYSGNQLEVKKIIKSK